MAQLCIFTMVYHAESSSPSTNGALSSPAPGAPRRRDEVEAQWCIPCGGGSIYGGIPRNGWFITHRIHGAAIYGNMDPINIPPMLAYVPYMDPSWVMENPIKMDDPMYRWFRTLIASETMLTHQLPRMILQVAFCCSMVTENSYHP